MEDIQRQISEQEIAMRELNKTWAEKLEEAMLQKSIWENDASLDKVTKEKKQTHPHLLNINDDPFLSGMLVVSSMRGINPLLAFH